MRYMGTVDYVIHSSQLTSHAYQVPVVSLARLQRDAWRIFKCSLRLISFQSTLMMKNVSINTTNFHIFKHSIVKARCISHPVVHSKSSSLMET